MNGEALKAKEAIQQYLAAMKAAHAQGDEGQGYVHAGSYFSTLDNLPDFVAAALSIRQQGDWVLVPRVEDDAMCQAGLEALQENLGHTAVIMRDAAACYRAMVFASPSASASPAQVIADENMFHPNRLTDHE